jgi:hypothetical protein
MLLEAQSFGQHSSAANADTLFVNLEEDFALAKTE